MAVVCRSCRLPVDGADVDEQHQLAACPRCGILFSLRPPVGAPAPPSRRPAPPLPRGLTEDESDGALSLSFAWPRPVGAFLAALGTAMLVYAAIVWFPPLFRGERIPLLFTPWVVLHGFGWVGFYYLALAFGLNSTDLRAGPGSLRVRVGPVPWPGSRTLAATDIDQLYCAQTTNRTRSGVESLLYSLNALLADGSRVCILPPGYDLGRDQALYLERRLEAALGIHDRPIPGELEK